MKAAGELSWNCREIIAFRQSMMASPEGFSGPGKKNLLPRESLKSIGADGSPA
jgi:hypothetical protein